MWKGGGEGAVSWEGSIAYLGRGSFCGRGDADFGEGANVGRGCFRGRGRGSRWRMWGFNPGRGNAEPRAPPRGWGDFRGAERGMPR